MVGLVWPIFACAAFYLEKFHNGMLFTEIDNAIDDGPLLLAPTALETNTLSSVSIDSISCVFVANLLV